MFSAFSSAELITHPALPTSGQSSISDTDYFGFETSAITTQVILEQQLPQKRLVQ